ncbi:hypothetical protein NX059_003215 [Plenodomus lindquistii]|nr:hypothetical protein NX059_003215 [Plenodomus lindquistii]
MMHFTSRPSQSGNSSCNCRRGPGPALAILFFQESRELSPTVALTYTHTPVSIMPRHNANASGVNTKGKRKSPPPLAVSQPFIWRAREWIEKMKITPVVTTMVNTSNPKLFVVRKVVRIAENGTLKRSDEAILLGWLPDCNRVAKPLVDFMIDEVHSVIIFEHFPLGDLRQWKVRDFDERNNKPVPESFIWRCFIQMSQALAFIHGDIGPDPDKTGHVLLHRDIKPHNVLVVDNKTTYPSFKLHDFGCARFIQEEDDEVSYCGTYKWQPPETPVVNTPEADIWALGACVHFLAVGRPPLQDLEDFVAQYREDQKDELWKLAEPLSRRDYMSTGKYCAARVPREVTSINLSPEEVQDLVERGLNPKTYYQYSDDLNDWMSLCLEFEPEKRPTAMHLLENMVDIGMGKLRSMGGKAALAHMEVSFEDGA